MDTHDSHGEVGNTNCTHGGDGARDTNGDGERDIAVAFLTAAGGLKTQKRTGWVNSGVALPESVADHTARMALMGVLAEDAGLDGRRAALIGLAHDLPEALCGDIVPGTIPAEEKHAREAAAMAQLMAALTAAGHPRAAALLTSAYDDYAQQRCPEAAWVKSCDKAEMLLQALEYEAAQPGLDLSQFFASTPVTAAVFKAPAVRGWAAEVARRWGALRAARAAAAPAGAPPSTKPAAAATTTPWWWAPPDAVTAAFFAGVLLGAAASCGLAAVALSGRRRGGAR